MKQVASRYRKELSVLRESWRRDVLASVVVFLVALPLCMGIAIASGVPPAAGLITGIVGGLVVAFMAGAPLQVSGPAAGLAVIVWELVQAHGVGALGWIVLVAGAIQLVAGIAGIGQWFRAVSPSVIYGMLAGIGVLIFGSQFHVMVDDTPRENGLANLLAIPEALYKSFLPADGSVHFQAAVVGVLTLVVMIGWRRMVPGSLKVVPAPLAAVVIATAVAALAGFSVNRVDVPAQLTDAITFPTLADLDSLGLGVLASGLAMAFVASAETLLCATAVDKLHDGPRTRFNQELAAQGVGNMICGLVGGLPMTGVIVRSSANVEAGARTRLSALLHGVWLLLFCAALPLVLRQIPTAVLAAVLVFTGYKLVNVAAIRELARFGRREVFIYSATLVGIVSVDLLTGVLIGVGLSVLRIVYDMSHLDVSLEKADDGSARCILHLDGAATILRLPTLARALEEVPAGAELHVNFEDLGYIDHACLDLLMSWEKQHATSGGSLTIDWAAIQARFRRPPQTPVAPLESGDRAAA
ncbi:MAG: SulP family inorganic anion transporter [Myxococcota bacterium]